MNLPHPVGNVRRARGRVARTLEDRLLLDQFARVVHAVALQLLVLAV